MGRRSKTRRPRGLGTLRERRPGVWAARAYVDGQRRYEEFPSREEAEAYLVSLRSKIRGLQSPPAGSPPDVSAIPTIRALVNGEPRGFVFGWMKRRLGSHRAGADDESRWKNHLDPFFGPMKPTEVSSAHVKEFAEGMLVKTSKKTGATYDPQTVKHCVNLLSTMFSDFIEHPDETGVTVNPVRALSKKVRKRIKPIHDPKLAPFLETNEHVAAVYDAMLGVGQTCSRCTNLLGPRNRSKLCATCQLEMGPTARADWGGPGRRPSRHPIVRPLQERIPLHERIAMAFAIGYYAFLRPGEILGLDWQFIYFDRGQFGQILVRQQVGEYKKPDGKTYRELGPVKDDDARDVAIPEKLLPLLQAYRLRTGGRGLLFPPEAPSRLSKGGTAARFMDSATLNKYLRRALETARIPPDPATGMPLDWYHCTRHTGASHWVKHGGSIEKLAALLGHSSTWVTERYAHLRPDAYTAKDMSLLNVDLRAPRGVVAALHRDAESTTLGTVRVPTPTHRGDSTRKH